MSEHATTSNVALADDVLLRPRGVIYGTLLARLAEMDRNGETDTLPVLRAWAEEVRGYPERLSQLGPRAVEFSDRSVKAIEALAAAGFQPTRRQGLFIALTAASLDEPAPPKDGEDFWRWAAALPYEGSDDALLDLRSFAHRRVAMGEATVATEAAAELETRALATWRASHPDGSPPEAERDAVVRWARAGEVPPASAAAFAAWASERWDGEEDRDPIRALLSAPGGGEPLQAAALQQRARMFWERRGAGDAFALWAATRLRDEGLPVPASVASRLVDAGMPVTVLSPGDDPMRWTQAEALAQAGRPIVYDDNTPAASTLRARAEAGLRIAATAVLLRQLMAEATSTQAMRVGQEKASRTSVQVAEQDLAARRQALAEEGFLAAPTSDSRRNDAGSARQREETAANEFQQRDEAAWRALRDLAARADTLPDRPAAFRSWLANRPSLPVDLRSLLDPEEALARLAGDGGRVMPRSLFEAAVRGQVSPISVVPVVRVLDDPQARALGILEDLAARRIDVSPAMTPDDLAEGPLSLLERARNDAWGQAFMQDNLEARARIAGAIFVYDDSDPARAPLLAEVARRERNLARMSEAFISLHREGIYSPIHALVSGPDRRDGRPKMAFYRAMPRALPEMPGVEAKREEFQRFFNRSPAEYLTLAELAISAPRGEEIPRDHQSLHVWLGEQDAIPSSLTHLADRVLDWRERGRVSQSAIEPRVLIGPPDDSHGLKGIRRQGREPATVADYRDGFWGDRAAKQSYAADYLDALRGAIIAGDPQVFDDLARRTGRRPGTERLQQQDDITLPVALVRHAALATAARFRDEIAEGSLVGPDALGERLRFVRLMERELLAHPLADAIGPAMRERIEASRTDTEKRLNQLRRGAAEEGERPTPALVAIVDPLDPFGGERLARAVRAAYPGKQPVEVWIPERPDRDGGSDRKQWRGEAAKRPFTRSVDVAETQGLLDGVILRMYRSEGMEPARGLSDAKGPFIRLIEDRVAAIEKSGADLDDQARLAGLIDRWSQTREITDTPSRETLALVFAPDYRGEPDLRRPAATDDRPVEALRALADRVAIEAALEGVGPNVGDPARQAIRTRDQEAISRMAEGGQVWAREVERQLANGASLVGAVAAIADPAARGRALELERIAAEGNDDRLRSQMLDAEAGRYIAALTLNHALRNPAAAPGFGVALQMRDQETIQAIAASQLADDASRRAAATVLARLDRDGDWREAIAEAAPVLAVPVAGRLQKLRAAGQSDAVADELRLVATVSTFGQRPRPLGERRIPINASEADAVTRERLDIKRLDEALRGLDGETEPEAIASGLSELRAAQARLGVEDSAAEGAGQTRAIQMIDDALLTVGRIMEGGNGVQPRSAALLDISEGHAERGLEQRRRLGQETWNVDDAEARLRRGAASIGASILTGQPVTRTGVDLERDGAFFDADERRRDVDLTFERFIAPQSESDAQRLADEADEVRRRPLSHPEGLVYREVWAPGAKLSEALAGAMKRPPSASEAPLLIDLRTRLGEAMLRNSDDSAQTALRGAVRAIGTAGEEGRLRNVPDLAAVAAAARDWTVTEQRTALAEMVLAWRAGGPRAMTEEEIRHATMRAAGIFKDNRPIASEQDTRSPDERRRAILAGASEGDLLVLRAAALTAARPTKRNGDQEVRSTPVASRDLGSAVLTVAQRAADPEQDPQAQTLRVKLSEALTGAADGNPFVGAMQPAVEAIAAADPGVLQANPDLGRVAQLARAWGQANDAALAVAYDAVHRHAEIIEREAGFRSQMVAAARTYGEAGAAALFDRAAPASLASREGRRLAAIWRQDRDGALTTRATFALDGFLGSEPKDPATLALQTAVREQGTPNARLDLIAATKAPLSEAGETARAAARELLAYREERAVALRDYLAAPALTLTPALRSVLKVEQLAPLRGRQKILEVTADGREYTPRTKTSDEDPGDLLSKAVKRQIVVSDRQAPVTAAAERTEFETVDISSWIGATAAMRLQRGIVTEGGGSTLDATVAGRSDEAVKPSLESLEAIREIPSEAARVAAGEGGEPGSGQRHAEASYTPNLDALVEARMRASRGLSRSQDAKLRFLEQATEQFQGSLAKVGRPWYAVSGKLLESDPSQAEVVLARGTDDPKVPQERRTETVAVPADARWRPAEEAALEAARAHATVLTNAERRPVLSQAERWTPVEIRLDPKQPSGDKVVVFSDGERRAEMAFAPNGRAVARPKLLNETQQSRIHAAHRFAAAAAAVPPREEGALRAYPLPSSVEERAAALAAIVSADAGPVARRRAAEAQIAFIGKATRAFRDDPERPSGNWRAAELHLDPTYRLGARAVTFEDAASGGRYTVAYDADARPLPGGQGIDPLDVVAAANRANRTVTAANAFVLADGALRPATGASEAEFARQARQGLSLDLATTERVEVRRIELSVPEASGNNPGTAARLCEMFGQGAFARTQAEFLQLATFNFRKASGEGWTPIALHIDPDRSNRARVVVFENRETGAATSDAFDRSGKRLPREVGKDPRVVARVANMAPEGTPFARLVVRETIERGAAVTAPLPEGEVRPALAEPEIHEKRRAQTAGTQDPIRVLRSLIRDGEEAFGRALATGEIDLRAISADEGIAGFHLVAGEGTPGMLKTALATGQDPRVIDAEGRMPTHHAALHPRAENLKLLLGAGLSPDDGDDRRRTPAMLAAQNRRPHHLSVLLEAGARLGRHDAKGKTTYDHIFAAKRGLPPERPDAAGIVPASEREARTAWIRTKEVFEQKAMDRLAQAISRGDEAVERLFATGFDPRISDPRTGRSATHELVSLGTPRMLEVGLSAGLPADATDNQGVRPLHLVERPEMVRALTAAGAKLDRVADDGTTPLARAVAEGRQDVAVALLEAGADPRKADASLAKQEPASARDAALDLAWRNAGGLASFAREIRSAVPPPDTPPTGPILKQMTGADGPVR